MPVYTVETAYHLPVNRQRSYDAPTPEEACLRAIEDDGWEDAKEDVDTSGETYVSGLWLGDDAAYSSEDLTIPEEFGETVQRKADILDEVVSLLREAARPMGLSRLDFERWLPRAVAALAKADAISGRSVPEAA